MEAGWPTRDDWPAALYGVALSATPVTLALEWIGGACSLAAGCPGVPPWHVTIALIAAFLGPAAVALALHRRRPLGGRVGRCLPADPAGRRIAVGAMVLLATTVAILLWTPGGILAKEPPAAGPLAVLLLPLHAAAWAAVATGDAAPAVLVTAAAVLAAALAGPWLVALATLLDSVWRRLAATAGDRQAVAVMAVVLVAAVGGAGALHVDVPYGRHVTWAEPADPPEPPAVLTNASARGVAARHGAVTTRNDLLETQGLHGDRRVGRVDVDCPTTRVLASDTAAVYVEVYCFPNATIISTPWAIERFSGPLHSVAATYAVRRDAVERVEAPVVAGHLLAPGRDLAGVDLAGADLAQVDLHGANLSDTDLRGTGLTAANLSDAPLWGADLRNASLVATDLRGADLTDADLRDATFDARTDAATRLVGADLRGATVGGRPTLAGVDARRARFDGAALGSGIAGAAADLSGARLAGASFAGAQLRQVTLDGAALRGADLGDAMLYRASLRDAAAREANLSGADLGLADLRGADLRDADLRGARLWEADLRGANLRGALLDGSRWREARLEDARLPDGESR